MQKQLVLDPKDPSSIFLATTFTWIIPGSSDSMYFSYFMLENIWYHDFAWNGPSSQEIVNSVPIVGPQEVKLNWNQFLVNSVHFRKNDDVICFLALKWRSTWGLSVMAFFEQKKYCLGRHRPILCIWGLKESDLNCVHLENKKSGKNYFTTNFHFQKKKWLKSREWMCTVISETT